MNKIKQIEGWAGYDKIIRWQVYNEIKDDIANYFVRRLSSGFVEGLNNKIKVIKRRCYGIFHLDHLFQRIFLDTQEYTMFK